MTNYSQIITNNSRILEAELCYRIVGCLIEVSRKYGHLHKERVYQQTCAEAFKRANLIFIAEPRIDIYSLDTGRKLATYNPDFLIDDKVIIEIKALPFTNYASINQLEQYLKASKEEVGIFVNFGRPRADIIRRIYTNDRKPWINS